MSGSLEPSAAEGSESCERRSRRHHVAAVDADLHDAAGMGAVRDLLVGQPRLQPADLPFELVDLQLLVDQGEALFALPFQPAQRNELRFVIQHGQPLTGVGKVELGVDHAVANDDPLLDQARSDAIFSSSSTRRRSTR